MFVGRSASGAALSTATDPATTIATRFLEPNTAPPPPRPSARPLSFMIAAIGASRRPAAPTVMTRTPRP